MNEASLQLSAGDYTARVALQGAELQSFTWRGQELLWEGDPAWWNRRAPLLFPVVGGVAGGHIHLDGKAHPMPKHGFARDRVWAPIAATLGTFELRLGDDAETRLHYPFTFDLRFRLTLDAQGLRMEVQLTNPGDRPLPAQFGFHPAFRWPLLPGEARDAHQLVFDEAEPDDLRRITGDLLSAERRPSPLRGDTLKLEDGLFEADALIWEHPRSRGLRYGVPGRPRLRVTWEAPAFACWTKPGAPFLCLEPWQGLADEVGFSGPFADRPGVLILAPGTSATWSMALAMEGPEGRR